MQTDRRFVQNIQHSAQAATELSSQSNTLGFTVRQRRSGPVECEVLKSYIVQEIDSANDLADQLAGDFLFAAVEFPAFEHFREAFDWRAANPVDRRVAETHRRRVVSQATTAAGTAFDFADQRLHPLTQDRRQSRGLFHRRVGPFVLERKLNFVVGVFHIEPAITGSIKDHATVARFHL